MTFSNFFLVMMALVAVGLVHSLDEDTWPGLPAVEQSWPDKAKLVLAGRQDRLSEEDLHLEPRANPEQVGPDPQDWTEQLVVGQEEALEELSKDLHEEQDEGIWPGLGLPGNSWPDMPDQLGLVSYETRQGNMPDEENEQLSREADDSEGWQDLFDLTETFGPDWHGNLDLEPSEVLLESREEEEQEPGLEPSKDVVGDSEEDLRASPYFIITTVSTTLSITSSITTYRFGTKCWHRDNCSKN